MIFFTEEAKNKGIVQKILLQLNNAGEEQKFGYSKEGLLNDFERILNLKGIEVVGIMNMAPLAASETDLEALFEDVRCFKQELEEKFGYEMRELSMGMSNDYHLAVKHGATMIRIGRKLFIFTNISLDESNVDSSYLIEDLSNGYSDYNCNLFTRDCENINILTRESLI